MFSDIFTRKEDINFIAGLVMHCLLQIQQSDEEEVGEKSNRKWDTINVTFLHLYFFLEFISAAQWKLWNDEFT